MSKAVSKPVEIVPHLPCHDGHDFKFSGDFYRKDDKAQRLKVWKCARCGSPLELFMPVKEPNAPDHAGNPAAQTAE